MHLGKILYVLLLEVIKWLRVFWSQSDVFSFDISSIFFPDFGIFNHFHSYTIVFPYLYSNDVGKS